MHKRREIALRRTNNQHQGAVEFDADLQDAKTLENWKNKVQRPSFFNKVSEQMSKVFSFDRTNSQVVNTMGKNSSSRN